MKIAKKEIILKEEDIENMEVILIIEKDQENIRIIEAEVDPMIGKEVTILILQVTLIHIHITTVLKVIINIPAIMRLILIKPIKKKKLNRSSINYVWLSETTKFNLIPNSSKYFGTFPQTNKKNSPNKRILIKKLANAF